MRIGLKAGLMVGCAMLAGCQEEKAEAPTEEVPAASGDQDAGGSDGGSGGSGETPGDPPPKPTRQDATRFLTQASFGAAPGDAEAVEDLGYAAWIEAQMAVPYTPYLDRLRAMSDAKRHHVTDLFWEAAVEGDEQLRARVAYALANVITVSLNVDRFWDHPETFAHYYDALSAHALGNYTDLVREVTMSPAMGLYLSHLGNRRADEEMGVAPDENYAREVMQLFTIGLEELNPDGTLKGTESYDTADVQGLAAVFTGLSWADTDFHHPRVRSYNEAAPMESFASFHEEAPKSFLGATIDVGGDAVVSVDAALDHLLAHPNLAPFVSKQLIQHLVTSNPSPAYVARVGAAFEAGAFEADGVRFGEGRRGDMAATVAAILMDPEARGAPSSAAHGRVRDPVLRFAHLARAFRDAEGAGRRGAPTETGALRYAHEQHVLGQAPLAPPSVFGWYRPGYVSPGGWAAEAGATAPEMQLATGSTMAGYVDWMARTIRSDVWGTEFFDLDLTALDALAEDPAGLVAEIDARLTAGAMQETTKSRIEEALALVTVDDRDTAKDREHRVRLALLMAVTSPEYVVAR